jgi:hypothetical protein
MGRGEGEGDGEGARERTLCREPRRRPNGGHSAGITILLFYLEAGFWREAQRLYEKRI